jgi:hypothetical protein
MFALLAGATLSTMINPSTPPKIAVLCMIAGIASCIVALVIWHDERKK